MNGWIKSWGGSLNTSHSSMSDGMMTDSDMSDLTKMSGTDFDHAFLTMMIQHHEGALAAAQVGPEEATERHLRASPRTPSGGSSILPS